MAPTVAATPRRDGRRLNRCTDRADHSFSEGCSMRLIHKTAAALGALGLGAAGLIVHTATAAGADTGDVHRITFPVQEKVSYSDDWLAPRAGHRHQVVALVAAVAGGISMGRGGDGHRISG